MIYFKRSREHRACGSFQFTTGWTTRKTAWVPRGKNLPPRRPRFPPLPRRFSSRPDTAKQLSKYPLTRNSVPEKRKNSTELLVTCCHIRCYEYAYQLSVYCHNEGVLWLDFRLKQVESGWMEATGRLLSSPNLFWDSP